MASLFQKEFTISSYELNPRGVARLTCIANYLQEVAYHHAGELGFGYEQMKERRTLWMLSRLKIQMFAYPVWNEKIVVETWPSGIHKLFAMRDFRIRDAQGEVMGIASSYWLIVDLDSHRPLRPGIEMQRFSSIEYGEPVFEALLEKLEMPEDGERFGQHKVVFSDLDIVGHVNNVKYIEWCIDASMSEEGLDKNISEFEINFLHEAVLGNDVLINGADQAGSLCLSAIREDDGQEIIRARLARS